MVVGYAGEFPRPEPPPPTVRAGNPFDANLLGNEVERRPQADILRAVDAVIVLIVVRGGQLARPGLLDKDMLGKKTRPARAHQLARELRGRAFESEGAVVWNSRPVAVIADEAPGTARRRVDALVGTGLLQVPLDAAAEHLDPVRENAFEENRAISTKAFNQILGDDHWLLPCSYDDDAVPGRWQLDGFIRGIDRSGFCVPIQSPPCAPASVRSEEHTSELQSHSDLVCRLLLEKKNIHKYSPQPTTIGLRA